MERIVIGGYRNFNNYEIFKDFVDLCIDCFDKVLDFILPQCKENPLSEYQFEGEIDI